MKVKPSLGSLRGVGITHRHRTREMNPRKTPGAAKSTTVFGVQCWDISCKVKDQLLHPEPLVMTIDAKFRLPRNNMEVNVASHIPGLRLKKLVPKKSQSLLENKTKHYEGLLNGPMGQGKRPCKTEKI